MSFTTDLLKGLAMLLDAEGAGTWDETGAYAEGATAIVLASVPQAPQRVICLTDYTPLPMSAGMSDQTHGIQVKTRAEDIDALHTIRDAVHDALHGLRRTQLPTGLWIGQAYWYSGAPLGPDQLARSMRTDNFYVDLNRPSSRLD